MSKHARSPEIRTGYDPDGQLKPPNWHGLVAWDLLCNNLASGLFLVAAIGELAAPEAVGPAARFAYPLALAFLVADLVLLVLDLGSPLRFHHMLRIFKAASPMSMGTWSLSAFALTMTVIVAFDLGSAAGLLPGESTALSWVRWLVLVYGVPTALASAVYKGVLFSTTAQPGWRDARWLGGYLVTSAFVLGCGVTLPLSLLIGDHRAAAVLRPVFAPLLVLNLVALGLLTVDLRSTLERTYNRPQLVRLGVVAIGIGSLVPLGLSPFAGSMWAILLALAALLSGGMVIRFAIVELPHDIQRSWGRYRSSSGRTEAPVPGP